MKKTNYPNNLYTEAGIKYIDVPKNAKDIMESMFMDSDITDKERDCLLQYYRDGQTRQQVNDSKTELIEHMHLSTRTYNALKRNDINSLYDLEMISEEELCAIKGFGAGCIAEIHACVEWYNTSVGA